MKNFKLLSIISMLLIISNLLAQNDNADKILGCWILTKMEYSQPEQNTDELINNALNSILCFEKNGKFSNANPKNSVTITGKYSFSKDGKTIVQNMDIPEDVRENNPELVRVDSDATIVSLDKNKLIFKAEYVTMHFERK